MRAQADCKMCIRSTDMPEDVDLIKVHRRIDKQEAALKLHIVEHSTQEQAFWAAHKATAESIDDLTAATKPLVRAIQAASTFRKFAVWLTGFSGIAALILWYKDLG